MPAAVSFTLGKCELPINLIKVENDKETYQGPRYHITACLGQIYHGFDNVNQLVEMLEVNLILGVDHLVLYNHTSSSVVKPYIRSFQKDGVLDFYSWYHPLVEREVGTHYFGNFILRNDCLYRYMYRSRYIIMTDIDEVIVPSADYDTLPMLMSSLSKSDNSEYVFNHVCFPNSWPSDPLMNASDNVAQRYQIRTLLKTNRTGEPLPDGHRSKYIIKPKNIAEAGVHTCYTHFGKEKRMYVNPSKGKLFHYRNTVTGTKLDLGTKIDNSMHHYADSIISRVSTRHDEVKKMTE